MHDRGDKRLGRADMEHEQQRHDGARIGHLDERHRPSRLWLVGARRRPRRPPTRSRRAPSRSASGRSSTRRISLAVPRPARASRCQRPGPAPDCRSRRRGPRFYFGGGTGNPATATQAVVETLAVAAAGSTSLGLRASQASLEILALVARGATSLGLRASQFVTEPLCVPSTVAYAGQIVVEALVPFLESPVIPVYPELPGLTIDVVKRPKWSTGKGVGSSGREVTVAYWSKPQWEWDLEYSALNDNGQYYQALAGADVKSLIGFTLQCMGAQSPFYFRDPTDDWQQTAAELGVGDGSTTAFLFQRTYGAGGFSGTEPVGGLNTGQNLVIYLNGVEQSTGFTISTATPCGNSVTFATPPDPGVVVTADFSFYYFCRFKDDTYDFTKFLNNMWTAKVSLFSLKN